MKDIFVRNLEEVVTSEEIAESLGNGKYLYLNCQHCSVFKMIIIILLFYLIDQHFFEL